MKAKTSMFLRFYGISADDITACLEELSELTTDLKEITRKPLTLSSMPVLPTAHNVEVWLHFRTSKGMEEFTRNPLSLEIYRRYAEPSVPGAEAVMKQPGEPVFKHAK